MGLELFEESELNRKNIGPLQEWAQPQGEKGILHLKRSLFFNGRFGEREKKFFAHVVNISPEGLECTCDFPFPIGEEFTLTFTVSDKVNPFTAAGKVNFQKEIGSPGAKDCPTSVYKTWIEFVDRDPVRKHLQDAGYRENR
jgi:hypothetical protein